MDATAITEEDKKNTPKFQPPQWHEIVAEEEQNFQAEREHSRRVKMDQLVEVNLGTKDKPRMVKVSANLDSEFKAELVQLLQEFRDIFVWSYADMKGLDPALAQHKIVLKQDAKPIQ